MVSEISTGMKRGMLISACAILFVLAIAIIFTTRGDSPDREVPEMDKALQAEDMSPLSGWQETEDDETASNQSKRIFWDNGAAEGTLDTTEDFTQLVIRGKADLYGEELPEGRFFIDGEEVGSVRFDSDDWQMYTIDGDWKAGSYTIKMEYDNDEGDRGIILDVISTPAIEFDLPAWVEELPYGNGPTLEDDTAEPDDSAAVEEAVEPDAADDAVREEDAVGGETDRPKRDADTGTEFDREYREGDGVESRDTQEVDRDADSSTAAAPASCTTTGSGGAFTYQPNQKFTFDGRTSGYHLYAEDRPQSESYGLLIQLHGDGAYEFGFPDSEKLGDLNAIAREQGLLMVSVKTPDTDTITWWEEGPDNAEVLEALLNEMIYAKYPIDMNRIWFSTYSGGSQFLTQWFLAEHADQLCGGGAVIAGGGMAGSWAPGDIAWSEQLQENFHLHFYTGQDDTSLPNEDYNAFASALEGIDYYKAQGFVHVTDEFPPGVDHFQLEEAREFGRFLENLPLSK